MIGSMHMRKCVFLLFLLFLWLTVGSPVHGKKPGSADNLEAIAGEEQVSPEWLEWGLVTGGGLLLLLLVGAGILRVQVGVRTRELQTEVVERQRAQEKLAALHALDRELVLTDDRQRIADAVVEAASRVLEFRVCGLWLVDQGSNTLVRYAHTAGNPVPDIDPLPLDGEQGITVAVARSGEQIYVSDVTADPRYISSGSTVRSELCVPLKVKERVIGTLNAESARPAAFSDDDQRLFQTLADVAAVALENARLHRVVADLAARLEEEVAARTHDLDRRSLELMVAAEVARDATRSVGLDELLNRAANLIRERFGFYHAGIFLVDEQGEYAVLRAATGNAGRQMLADGHKLKVGEVGMVGYVIQTGHPRIVLDVGADAVHFENPLLPETRSEMTLPLQVGERIIGALDVQSRREAAFDKGDVAVLRIMADQLAVAIEKARLFEQTQAILEERLGTVVSNAPIILFALDREGTITLAEGKGLGTPGLVPDGSIGQSIFALYPDAPEVLETVRRALAGETLTSTIHLAGSVFEAWCSPLYDPSGSVSGAMSVLTDITERVQAEDALRRYAERLKTMYKIDQAVLEAQSPEAIAQAALDHMRTLVPCYTATVHLYDSEQREVTPLAFYCNGKAESEFDPATWEAAGTMEGTEDIIAELGQGHAYVNQDIRAISQPPPVFQLLQAMGVSSFCAVPLVAHSELIGFINLGAEELDAFGEEHIEIAHEVAASLAVAIQQARLHQQVQRHATELEQSVAERTAELREEQARIRAILDAAGEGIIVTNLAGAILYMNPAASRLTGYSLSEASLDTPRLWNSGKHSQEFYEQMWKTILSGEVWRGELINERKDGTLYDAALTIAPISDGQGRPMGFVGIQNDISHLKELDRLKDEFVSNVSHELRTPLANIRLYLSLLQRGKQERREYHLKVLHRETDRLGGLIEDLLNLSRLDRAETVPMESVNLEAIVAGVLTSHLLQAEVSQIDLSLEPQPNLPLAWANRAQIIQVLTNLLGNALAYTPTGGQVTVSLSQGGSDGRAHVVVAVADNGPGISAKDLPHIFDRFYRGAAGRQSSAPGSGLGLSICKKIVDFHGGRIEVESEEGQGTTFTVWLPVAPRVSG
jgi:PAS domain S-box-containing protein